MKSAADPDDACRAKRVDYALLVVAQRADGVLMAQVYTTMRPAARKVRATRERGLAASMTLVRLQPVASSVDPADVLDEDDE